ncbi:MAG: virulence factor MviN, partial [Streptosporangiales bacterium]|nr:virulence factor MviN [Streptosporangiales bacterium]
MAARLGAGIAGAAILIGAITVLSRLVGFGRNLVFARTVGQTCLGTAYFSANQVPTIVFEIVVGGALTSIVVPVLAGPIARGAFGDTRRIASALLTWACLILVPLTVVGFFVAGPVVALLVGEVRGCAPDQVAAVGTRMLLVFLPQLVLYGIAVVLYGVLQAHRRFLAPALAPLVSSIVVIAAYLAFVPFGGGRQNDLARLPGEAELILSVGTTLGVAALVLTAGVPAVRLGLRLRPTLSFPAGVAVRVRRLALAGVATVAAQQLAAVAVIVLANGYGGRGALPLYTYAWALYLVPYAVLALPIATSSFPALSARADAGDDHGFAGTMAPTTRAVVLVSFAAAGILAAVASPTARVFVLGGPGDADPLQLQAAVAAFAPGLVGYGLVAHVSRALYAAGRGRAAGTSVVAGWAVVILADVVLVRYVPPEWVVAALGLGNTVGMTVGGALLLASLYRARGRDALAGLGRAAAAGLL